LRDKLECELLAQTTDETAPGFATLLKDGNGLLNFRLPEPQGGCLLVFSNPSRAADYARVQVPGKEFQFFCSSAEQVVSVVADFRQHAGITHVALDQCSRSNVVTVLGPSSLDSAAKIVQMWKIWKATEIAPCGLYFGYAQAAARAEQFLVARDVALELVGHVTAEDPRVHLLLGKLAIKLLDKRLMREAKDFLVFLKQNAVIQELADAQKTKRVQF
jgi:hypothetical protein